MEAKIVPGNCEKIVDFVSVPLLAAEVYTKVSTIQINNIKNGIRQRRITSVNLTLPTKAEIRLPKRMRTTVATTRKIRDSVLIKDFMRWKR